MYQPNKTLKIHSPKQWPRQNGQRQNGSSQNRQLQSGPRHNGPHFPTRNAPPQNQVQEAMREHLGNSVCGVLPIAEACLNVSSVTNRARSLPGILDSSVCPQPVCTTTACPETSQNIIGCKLCRQTGHTMYECPSIPGRVYVEDLRHNPYQPITNVCQLCGDASHLAFYCPFVYSVCGSCGKRGHVDEICIRAHMAALGSEASLLQQSDQANMRVIPIDSNGNMVIVEQKWDPVEDFITRME